MEHVYVLPWDCANVSAHDDLHRLETAIVTLANFWAGERHSNMSEGWVIPEDSSVSHDAPDFFHVKHVPIKQIATYKSLRRETSKDLLVDPRFSAVQDVPDAHKERRKNHSRMLHTDVGDLVQMKPVARVQGQDFPVLFPHGVNHRQALQLDPEGDGMRELPKKTLLPHSIHSMSDMLTRFAFVSSNRCSSAHARAFCLLFFLILLYISCACSL